MQANIMAIQDIIDFLEKNYPRSSSLTRRRGDYYTMVFVIPSSSEYFFSTGFVITDTSTFKEYEENDKKVIVVKFSHYLTCRLTSNNKVIDPYITHVRKIDHLGFSGYGSHDYRRLIKEFDDLINKKSGSENKVATFQVKKLLPGALDLLKECRVLILQASNSLREDAELLATDIIEFTTSGKIINVTRLDQSLTDDIRVALREGPVIIVSEYSLEQLFPDGLDLEKDKKIRVVELTASPYETTEVKLAYESMRFP